ncbi:hypothetical protein CH330_03575 [candidate division WOR-3 bacterium JGI_Cruoil_03_51_56]|uniref:ESX-1 secretion system protein EccA1-like N-terminal domain-containing protein n=1 Tax=candidate division WOR-3 bacterium JGI_Cruoil_03_51_56 TaxID=1973747 RepID=A0A235BVQ7_UNCW3|nr:MAG: hypothetical protein CH330_03575 [candidate division WOR-3 bacterium JGI_Cruoil_03_51_56]
MRFKGKHRVRKAELKEDKFQVFTEKLAEFYYRDKQKFWVIIVLVLVVIVGGIVLIQGRGKGVNSEAQLRFTEALGIFTQGDMQQAEEAFTNLTTRYGRDQAGIKAHYYLGQIYYSSQRYKEAEQEFEKFLKKVHKDPILSPAAHFGVADCEEELGSFLKAAQRYEEVYRDYPDSPLAFDAMMAAGRAYTKAGAFDKAEAMFHEFLDKNPTGEKAEKLKVQLAYVKTLQQKF